MTTNPYASPNALNELTPANKSHLDEHDESTPPYFAVSLPKLAILSVCSLGLYELYWFYRNWRLIRDREKTAIYPFMRAFFAVLFCYSCFAKIRDHGQRLHIAPPLAAGGWAACWIIATISWKLPDPYWLASMLAVGFLLPVQAYVNRINRASAPMHDPNNRFSAGNWLLIVVGGAMLTLAIIGTFMPGD